MDIEILPDETAVARRAAELLAEEASRAIEARGAFVVALSGGRTPWAMMRALGGQTVDWPAVQIAQVDERVAPAGDKDRNLTHLLEALLPHTGLDREQIHAMPVEEPDLAQAAAEYAAVLQGMIGSPITFDLVHLGLGADGHTASLVPGDAVLDVERRDVAPTAPYQGRRRLTLTFPVLNRARRILWVVTGGEKRDALARLMAADRSIPAGRVRQDRAVLLADTAAADGLQIEPARKSSRG